jgi:hypothetical protein
MTAIRRAAAGSVLALVLALPLAACGRGNPAPAPAPPGTAPTTEVTTPPATTPPATTPPATTSPMPGARVLSARVAYQWRWPNWNGPATVTHPGRVPLPQLVAIGAGDHPRDPGERPFNRMSFTFTTAFPSYRVGFVDTLVADGSGKPIPLKGLGVVRVVFHGAQAHSEDGTRSTIVTQPSRNLGFVRMVDYAQAGDFEGVLTYGIGIAWPVPHSNPQIAVRAYEVETLTAQGQHRYVVAIDVDAS